MHYLPYCALFAAEGIGEERKKRKEGEGREEESADCPILFDLRALPRREEEGKREGERRGERKGRKASIRSQPAKRSGKRRRGKKKEEREEEEGGSS